VTEVVSHVGVLNSVVANMSLVIEDSSIIDKDIHMLELPLNLFREMLDRGAGHQIEMVVVNAA